ncbi:MAG TPA: nickel pincer cofactor biosynthesis protein LarC [Verrucomicrobiae bacterium]|nr:nickel pincer cofactor biosynthesis protein LarC [Verrucomicrobiae bacterium]
MKTLYLDIISGISGDMFIGATVDLGVDATALEHELQKLKLDGWRLNVGRGQKMGISGTKFDVHLVHEHAHAHTHADGTTHTHPHSHEHGHRHDQAHECGPHGGLLVKTSFGKVELSVFETDVPPRFRLYFFDSTGKSLAPIAAKSVALETVRSKKRHELFQFKRQGDYLEATEELPEPHEFTAVLKLKLGSRTERRETRFVEDHHHHDHDGVHKQQHHHGRNFAEIENLIRTSALSDWVKQKAAAVFQRIAVAEGRIHGMPPEQVHFHEVGAVDSIVDIVGACVALDLLGKPRVLAAPVVEGTGWINCAHGRFPVPAPATLAILGERGVGVTQCEEPHELVTPTGAALLAEFVEDFGPMEGLVAAKIGYGLGTRDNRTRPNVLRAVLGESSAAVGAADHDWETDTVAVIETNLDDVAGEILGHFVEKAFAEGALDVFHTPIQMKKNRPGVLLTVLCAAAEADRFSELLLRETSAFGVRRYAAERRKLKRTIVTVKTPFGEVTVKVGTLDGTTVQVAPEYESCRKLAEQAGVPLKQVYDAALQAVKS